MNKTIVYQGREYSVYGWKQTVVSPLLKGPENKKQEAASFGPGPVTFSCAVTFAAGSCFTLKETREIFEIISSEINQHQARKIGEGKAGSTKTVFLACPQ